MVHFHTYIYVTTICNNIIYTLLYLGLSSKRGRVTIKVGKYRGPFISLIQSTFSMCEEISRNFIGVSNLIQGSFVVIFIKIKKEKLLST